MFYVMEGREMNEFGGQGEKEKERGKEKEINRERKSESNREREPEDMRRKLESKSDK